MGERAVVGVGIEDVYISMQLKEHELNVSLIYKVL